MIDASAVKSCLPSKTFSNFAYVWLIFQFLYGVPLSSRVGELKEDELQHFSCRVATETAVRADVEKTCFNEYEETFNSPFPFHLFVSLSIWVPFGVAVIYSFAVDRRVKEIVSSHEAQTDCEANNAEQNRNTSYVFYGYLIHLLIRLLFGVLFSILQYTVFFPNAFDFKFSCSQPTAKVTSNVNDAIVSSFNGSSISCENSSAREKDICGFSVCALNSVVAFMILAELILLCQRFPSFKCTNGSNCDTYFVIKYLCRKPYVRVRSNHDRDEATTRSVRELTEAHLEEARQNSEPELRSVECIDFYKQQVRNTSRSTDIFYGQKTGLDDLFVKVVIHTERARHEFPEGMDRHEIYRSDVYRKVPEHSILLESIKDLFSPNKDTKNTIPLTILATGRPGIGKTVLTKKIMRDWAKTASKTAKSEVDEYYCDKIAFHFKFRWFSHNELKKVTLKTFLCSASRLSDEIFESLYAVITNQPDKVLLIFDGLDEFPGDFQKCLDQQPPPDDANTCMPEIFLFIKLISGQLLHGATVLVTSRPTASDCYSRLQFDRNVEIIGFTSDKIEEYVGKFCDNHNRSDLKPKIWNHIKSSSDLLNLSYIPVNCFIVSVMLFDCLSDSSNETGVLPTTITELYQAAIDHFHKYHNKTAHVQSSEDAMKKLQLLAYKGIESGKLIFNEEEFDEEMKKSGLLNCLSNPLFPVQTQFCFIHLTTQEFLAAKYVTETKDPKEIKKLISSHIRMDQWHLVLQFIAGLLGKKMKTFPSEIDRYKDCVSAFVSEEFEISESGVLELNYFSLFIMKSLSELGIEDLIREACETTALNDVVSLKDYNSGELLSNDLAAVVFVCKYMKKLRNFYLHYFAANQECCLETYKLLQQRCIRELQLHYIYNYKALASVLFTTLMNSKCKLGHEHSNLHFLVLDRLHITDECLTTVCEFFANGHGRRLEKLFLINCRWTPRGWMSILNKILDNKLCPELTCLELNGNSLTDEFIPELSKALLDEHCVLNELRLYGNEFTEEGQKLLRELETHKDCKSRGLKILL